MVARNHHHVVRMAASVSSTPEATTMKKMRNPVSLLWRFSRPHTLIGTTLSVPAVSLLAAPTFASALTGQFWSCAMGALVPALLVNVFITGLNQVCDADIDRINKPTLPIAAGELSEREGLVVCFGCLALALASAIPVASTPLVGVLAGSALLGAAYSAPPLRLKRWPLLAALSIVAVRGALVNVCFFLHARAHAFSDLGRSAAEAHLGVVVAFFALFGVGIALLKDVPDTAGDERFDIPTLSTKIGRTAVFNGASALITALLAAASAAFGWAAAFAAITTKTASIALASRLLAATTFAALAISSFQAAKNTNPDRDQPVTVYYMLIWKIFYLSYALLPLLR